MFRSATEAPRWSLQQRLWRHVLLLMVSGWLAAAGAAMFGVWHETDEVLDDALAQTALRLLDLPDAALTVETATRPRGEDGDYVMLQVFDRHGRLRLRSAAAPAGPMDPLGSDGLRDVGRWHVLTMNSADGERRVLVAETIAHRREVLWHSLRWMLLALLLVVPLAALALRWLMHRAFAGVERARQSLARLDVQRLAPLQVADLPDELRPWLAGTNTLLSRLRAMVDAERAFAAHTAHELRTPLAAARAQAQRLAHITSDEAARQSAEALVRQLDRLTRISTRLLQLARVESGVALGREPVDLVQMAQLVIDEFDAESREGRLLLQVQGRPPPVPGDIDALGIALRNLIDNALRHAGPPARVDVQVGPGWLAVQDDGPGVDAAELPRLVGRFERGASAAEGSGLGLAIVDAIARQLGARLVLHSPLEAGRGFRAELHFAGGTAA